MKHNTGGQSMVERRVFEVFQKCFQFYSPL